MLILLTNDDGIHAPGIVAMYRELVKLGEVHVIAPETVQSATGHGITIATPLLTSKVTVQEVYTGIAVDGRPADCVKLAIDQLLPRKPDLVVSGLNAGANTGINVIYSGTVAAAIEAAFLGLPSIAVSQVLVAEITPDYARAAKFAMTAIRQIVDAGLAGGQCVSVNLPPLRETEVPTGIKVTRQCLRPWVDTYERRQDPRGRDYYWNNSVFTLGPTEEDTDVAAVRDGYIAITPLQFDMTRYPQVREWQGRKWSVKAE
jgi:5'-nucleotidase